MMEIGRLGVGASVKGLLVGLVLCAGALAWKPSYRISIGIIVLYL